MKRLIMKSRFDYAVEDDRIIVLNPLRSTKIFSFERVSGNIELDREEIRHSFQ